MARGTALLDFNSFSLEFEELNKMMLFKANFSTFRPVRL